MGTPDERKKQDSALSRALAEYVRLLQDRPVITKAITNGVVSGFGNLLSQVLAPDVSTGGRMNWRSVFAYSSFGFLVNGPLIHHFYVYLEKIMPKNRPNAGIKRVLFDRFIFAPPFLLLFLYYVSIVEGAGQEGAVKKIKEQYWMILKLNWTVWSVVQYININFVPLKFRTLFGNLCALVWMVFISVKRRQMALKSS
ncbi:peroxisomal membrane protein 2 [Aplysia californica]|uniref:Peroxisomal membrane protein 2 n=1 Tax=Aplysia californica TaxID=6500 RepID=A0ABM0K9U6_APLCA|nr:peroxisomal membrane protein 2 [Aplysia californica]